MHGSKDEDVPYGQSVEMCDQMKQAGARCELVTIDGVRMGWTTGSLIRISVYKKRWWIGCRKR